MIPAFAIAIVSKEPPRAAKCSSPTVPLLFQLDILMKWYIEYEKEIQTLFAEIKLQSHACRLGVRQKMVSVYKLT